MSKQAALKLAKEMGIPVSKEWTDWKGVLTELKAERQYDKVMDQIEVSNKAAKIKFKPVLKDLQAHKRNRIEIDIPVERTDPPTVSRAVVNRQIDDINFYDYTIGFKVLVMKQELDEFGQEKEWEDYTPEEPIRHRDFLKKYEKRTAGALTGFLNNYIRTLMKSLTWVKKIVLVLTKRVKNKRALTPNFGDFAVPKNDLDMNCVIKIVDEMVQKRKDYQKKLKPKIDALNKKYLVTGAAEQAIDDLCAAVQVNIHIVSILQETWYHRHIGDNKLTILICSHNGHATQITDFRDLSDFLEPEKVKKVEYLETSLTNHFLANKTPITFPIVIKDQIVAYYDYNGNLYKNRDIFYDEQDWKKNKDNPDLKSVYTLTSRYYKELKAKYKLQDWYRDADLYHFVRCSDLYAPPWCTDPDYAENGQAFDQDRAYMFYEKSSYYEHYQFPRMPTHFYNVSDQKMQCNLLQLTGFAQVANITIPNHKKLEYVRRTHMIQESGVYTTMRLAWLASLGITFDITRIAFSNDKQKIDFHLKLTEWQNDEGLSVKQEECALMGRLIPNQSRQFTSVVHCVDENEFLQLRFQLGSRVLNVDFDKKMIYYTTEQTAALKGAIHVHAYILDYQQIEFATKAMSVPFEKILKVKVDCLVLERPTIQTFARDLRIKFTEKTGRKCPWTEAAICEWIEDAGHVQSFARTPLDGFTEGIDSKDIALKWAGFHEEMEINSCKTAHIDEVDFTHRQYKMIPQLNELPTSLDGASSPALHRFIDLTGNAGTGKTYYATHMNLYDACMLVPTHALRVKFKKENPELPCMTYHKAFNTNHKKGEYTPERKQYSTYIMDECSMICKGVMNNILNDKNALNANIVLIHDQAQLAAVTPDNSTWEDPKSRYFTYGKEYKKRNWHKIHLTKQMRQNDPAFIAVLDKLREMQDKCNSLPKMIDLLKGRIISQDDALKLYRYDTEDIMIASTNDEVDRWNTLLKKQAKANELKLKYTATAKNGAYVNNERVIMQTDQMACQELAFAGTIHLVQGITFTDRLFISLSLLKKNCNFDPHLFYTAVSRIKTSDNLYLVK